MIKVVTNSNGSGDWIVVQGQGGSTLLEGHRINPDDIVELLTSVGVDATLLEVNDEQMEQGEY